MSLMWLIYFADISNGISFALGAIGWAFIVLSSIFGWVLVQDKVLKKYQLFLAYAFSLFLILISIIMPSSKAIYTMAAVSYGQQIIENPRAKLLEDKVYVILNQKLDELVGRGK